VSQQPQPEKRPLQAADRSSRGEHLDETYAALVDDAPYGLIVLSTDLRILYANHVCEEIFSFAPGHRPGDVKEIVAPRHLERLRLYRDACLLGRRVPARYDLEAMRADGSMVTIQVLVGLAHWAGEPAIQLCVVDVNTSTRDLEQAREATHRLASQQAALLALARQRTEDTSLEDQVGFATEIAGTTLGCARVGVWLFEDQGTLIRCEDLFEVSTATHSRGQRLERADCPSYFEALDTELTIDADDALSDPRTRELAPGYLRPLGIGAMMDAPIRAGGVSLGVVCHEHVGATRPWRPDEKTFANAVASWIAVAVQLAERRRSESELRASEKRYRELFDAAPVSLWEEDWSGVKRMIDRWQEAHEQDLNTFLDEHPKALREAAAAIEIIDVNQATTSLYRARSQADLLGAVRERLGGPAFPGFRHRLLALANGHCRVTTEERDERLDGEPFDARITLQVPEPYRRDWRRMFASVEDTTEARDLSRRLTYEATHDGLTELTNRREFERRLQRALSDDTDADRRHVLCYLDLDQFKVINDRCGHVAGDQLLREVAQILGARVSRCDTLARLGGDEFAVLLERCGLSRARELAEELRRSVETFRFNWAGRVFNIGASIGVVPVTPEHTAITDVMGAADAACYAAKEQGRNRVYVYRADDAEMMRRHDEMEWATRIDTALRENRLRLFRQSIVPIGSGQNPFEHYEVLLRLESENGDIVPPGAFLPAAERFGLTERIDRWVIDTVLRWLGAHRDHLDRLGRCSINLSGQSIGRDGFVDSIVALLDQHHVPATKLCFEITETAAIENLDQAAELMGRLGRLGCAIALDDFGSGLSSFAYLRNLPVDLVKIDGVFVRDMVDNPIDRAMVRSINDIGHVMGKKTIAEFVENDAILEALAEIGVDFAQGYGVGRPAPLD
jgi:diguanylate cyclase (GGDEF)-like protein/PAS domain S-box-containing protein